jgi:hypothetical protein
MKRMRKNFSNEKFSQAVAFEAANRAMNRKVLEYLRNMASSETTTENKVAKPKKAASAAKTETEPVEGEAKPKKAARAKKAAADETKPAE